MLVHNAHAVYCLKYFTLKLTLVPILLHYFYLCCAHDCNIDAHAKNIPTPFMSCARFCAPNPATDIKVSSPPSARGLLGGICVYTCNVRTDCVCTVVSWSDMDLISVRRLHSTDVARPIRDQLAATALTN